MRTTRVYVALELRVGAEVPLPAAQSRHLFQVLRLSPGDPLVLFNGDGQDYSASLVESGRHGVRARIEGKGGLEGPAPLDIQLALGVSRGERMDFALQKAVELGVGRIAPLFTDRSQVRLDESRLEKRMAHWTGVVISACEQCGRRRLPRLERAESLAAWLDRPTEGGLLLDPLATDALTSLPAPSGGVTLLVGPEGGLSQGERTAALLRGYRGVRLGPRILRTETAPLAAISVIQALWGDFRDA